MNKLLEFIIAHFSYLYDEFGCRFVDSKVGGPNAVLVLEVDELRLGFLRDRGQILLDFKNKNRRTHCFSFGMVRQLITGEAGGSEVLDSDKARYVYEHFLDIKVAFSNENVKETEKMLTKFEHERGVRLFGK